MDENDIKTHPKDHLTPVLFLFHEYPTWQYTQYLPYLSDIKLLKPQLDITKYLFDIDQVSTIDIELPPSGNYPIISIMYDSIFDIQYIKKNLQWLTSIFTAI